MKVKLIQYTPNPEKVIAAAAKLCYSKVGIDDIMKNLTDEKIEKFIDMLMELGHESPLEHVSFTFAIEGVSRSLTHQLVRHRIASYSQQSQRYVNLENSFEYIVPPAIKENGMEMIYEACMFKIHDYYTFFTKNLKDMYIAQGMNDKQAEKKAIEDARYVLPNACETKIVVTMNARSLLNFFNHRCCNRAQWEIRNLATEMLKEVKKVAPNIFKNAGPKCLKGRCPEGLMTCGKINEVREKFKNF